jgi:K+-transporting ATPase A subunit
MYTTDDFLENIGQRIETLKQTARVTDYLFVTSELDYHIAQVYWFNQNRVRIIGKKYEDIPQYVGKVLIPRSAVVTTNPCISSCTVYILDQSRKIHTWIR